MIEVSKIISREIIDKFEIYLEMLTKWQKAINLVSSQSLEDASERHFSDSVQIEKYIPTGVKKIADLGSGGGFPGMVLAMIRPDLDIHLIESDERKSKFLENVSRETMTNVSVHNQRVENIIEVINPDLITARAFASLINTLSFVYPCALKNPFLQMLFLKGQKAKDEVKKAKQRYNFEVEYFQSGTDRDAKILLLKNLQKF